MESCFGEVNVDLRYLWMTSKGIYLMLGGENTSFRAPVRGRNIDLGMMIPK